MQIEIGGHYYYRDENHIPKRITIVTAGEKPGFFWCVSGHFSLEEITEKQMETFLIHRNRIIQ